MARKITVNIIGGGNVATHLIREFLRNPEIEINQFYSRNLDQIKEFEGIAPMINDISLLKPADISIISISDDAVSEFSNQLKHYANLVVHTSGSVSIDDLKTKRKGVFYPFQTFSKAKKEINFKEIPILIEAQNDEDLDLLERLGNIISNDVQVINSKQRMALHIAGVLVANFVNHLYYQADKLLNNNKLSFDLLKPLILETAHKILTINPKNAQTGPAVRNDKMIIDKHLKFIDDKNLNDIYRLLSKSIQENK